MSMHPGIWLAFLALIGACNPTNWQDRAHTALNVVTDIADPAYAVVTVACNAREEAVLADSSMEMPAKRNAIHEARAICDPIIQQFELLIQLQGAARSLVDKAAAGQADWKQAAEAAQLGTTGLFLAPLAADSVDNMMNLSAAIGEGNAGDILAEGVKKAAERIGKGLARAILLGQEYAEITHIAVGDGTLTFSGRYSAQIPGA